MSMAEYQVATEDEISEDEYVVVEVEGKEIGIFQIDGEYHAYLNWCVHQGGPVCEGVLTGTQSAEYHSEDLTQDLQWIREGEILNCPWHGWEYDIKSGKCLSNKKAEMMSFPVRVEDDQIIVTV